MGFQSHRSLKGAQPFSNVMTLTSVLVKILATTVFAASLVMVPPLVPGTPKIEQPVVMAATTTLPIATTTPPVKKKHKTSTPPAPGNCLAYQEIINKYDWSTTTAMAVCGAESHGYAGNIGDTDTAYVSCGLMQIRTLPGRPSCETLKDPETNIAYAYAMWKREGWRPWSTCRYAVDCTL